MVPNADNLNAEVKSLKLQFRRLLDAYQGDKYSKLTKAQESYSRWLKSTWRSKWLSRLHSDGMGSLGLMCQVGPKVVVKTTA